MRNYLVYGAIRKKNEYQNRNCIVTHFVTDLDLNDSLAGTAELDRPKMKKKISMNVKNKTR